MFQDLGSRLKRVLTGDRAPVSPTENTAQEVADQRYEEQLRNTNFIASGVLLKASSSNDYRISAESIRPELESAQEQLEQTIMPFKRFSDWNISEHRELSDALLSLARIDTILGCYEEAEASYTLICPQLLLTPPKSPLSRTPRETRCVIEYLEFLARTGRRLKDAEGIGKLLLEELSSSNSTKTTEAHCYLLLTLVRIYNAQDEHLQAAKYMENLEASECDISVKTVLDLEIRLLRASTSAKLHQEPKARHDFLHGLIMSAVGHGIWYSTTLDILEHFGIMLKDVQNDKAASWILFECFLGRAHRYGSLHPSTRRVYKILKNCTHTEQHSGGLGEFDERLLMIDSRLSIAYEHIYLDTIVGLLATTGENHFEEMAQILQAMVEHPPKTEMTEHRANLILRIHRALARCKFEQGKELEAIALIEEQESILKAKRSSEGQLQSKLDLAQFYAANSNNYVKATTLSLEILVNAEEKLTREQTMAYHRKLSLLGLTHFAHEIMVKTPLPIEVIDNVGTGAYAIVESIKINNRLYARKSINLPRYNQKRIREIIQNEVSVIQSLKHPHIVQVYCTYEEKSRFAIVLEPLASCDLEAFLEKLSALDDPNAEHQKLLWKWFGCLANTLAFIHSKGIRHKDIKTRNILVKDLGVIFADFGSSHAFLDEGTSVTEGPAYGHTLMYCAPEVVSWEKRSRPADIFSLGCVFSEMATVLMGSPVSDYFEFRCKPSESSAGGETHAYHTTLDLVDKWFDDASPKVKDLYSWVIVPMLAQKPEDRPTAYDASRAILAFDDRPDRNDSRFACFCHPVET